MSNVLNQMRFSPAAKVVRGQCVTAFQAAVPDVLGKVRDIGHEGADTSSEEEQCCHPATNEANVSTMNYCRQPFVHGKGSKLTACLCPSRA